MGGVSCKDNLLLQKKRELLNSFEFYQTTKSTNLRLIVAKENEDVFTNNTRIKVYMRKWVDILSLSSNDFHSCMNNSPTPPSRKGKSISISSTSLTLSQLAQEEYQSENKTMNTIVQILLRSININEDLTIRYLSKGPPNRLRWALWLSVVLHRKSMKMFPKKEEYKDLISQNLDSYYAMQISKDLQRSAPEVNYFHLQEGTNSLFNVLKALAIHDIELSYCQGLNILIANFLLISDGNEVETFYLSQYILYHHQMKGFFLEGFPKLNEYIFISKDLIKQMLPEIASMLTGLMIPDEVWIFKWIQTCFSIPLSLEITVRLWDCIFCFGLDFLFNYTLAFLHCFEKELLTKVTDIGEFVETFSIKFDKEDQAILFREKLIKKAMKLNIKEKIEKSRSIYRGVSSTSTNQSPTRHVSFADPVKIICNSDFESMCSTPNSCSDADKNNSVGEDDYFKFNDTTITSANLKCKSCKFVTKPEKFSFPLQIHLLKHEETDTVMDINEEIMKEEILIKSQINSLNCVPNMIKK